jgi:phospholipid-binding lipoprotein MlaA
MMNNYHNTRTVHIREICLIFFCAICLFGCATTNTRNPVDPIEPFNRVIFQFNESVDRAVFKPTAQAYRAVVPKGVRTILGNVFSNIGEIFNIANNLLQGKPIETTESFMRFSINSVFGLGGMIDIASEMGLQRHRQDFGLTLGVWGVPAGPYLVLPFIGSSSVRDSVGTGVYIMADPITHYSNVPLRNSVNAVRLIDARAKLLDAGNLLEEAAFDKYSFMRDAYLQRREFLLQNTETMPEETDHHSDESK